MADTSGNSNFTKTSVFSEKSLQTDILELAKQEIYTKAEIMTILNPMIQYLEVLSDAFELKKDGTTYKYTKPNF